MVPAGFEPATNDLKGRCSTIELKHQKVLEGILYPLGELNIALDFELKLKHIVDSVFADREHRISVLYTLHHAIITILISTRIVADIFHNGRSKAKVAKEVSFHRADMLDYFLNKVKVIRLK